MSRGPDLVQRRFSPPAAIFHVLTGAPTMRRTALLALAASALAVPALAADPVEGDWIVQGGSARVKIAPCAGQTQRLCGRIVWLKNPKGPDGQPVKDAANPDPKLRDQPLIGLHLIRDFTPVKPGQWTGGLIYDPRNGRSYKSKMALNPDGTLKVEGCISVVCQAQTWRRAS